MLRSASCRITSALAFTAVLSLAALVSAQSPTKAKIDELIAQLSTSSPETRAQAAEQLGDLPFDETRVAVPFLVRALRDESPLVRRRAVEALGRLESKARGDVRRAAAAALRRMGPAMAPAIPDLAQAMKDPNDAVLREQAAHALSQVGHTAEADAALWAAHTLARLGAVARPAIPALRQALKDSTEMSREAIRHAIEDIEGAEDAGTAESRTASSRGADP
jgi:HEAT repeat protein